jgi:hypothetical protein
VWAAGVAAAGLVAASAGPAPAAPVPVGNHSFESPDVPNSSPYASPVIDVWQKLGGTFQTGIFYNTADAGAPPVTGADGEQLGFIFADPTTGSGLAQDLFDGSTPIRYQVGRSYQLRVALQGGGGGMPAGVRLALQLYYVDPTIVAGDNRVPVATNTVSNTNVGPITALSDQVVDVPTVTAGQAWAGRQVGIRMVSVDNPAVTESGYWDVDNVRLTAVPEPAAAGLLGGGAILGLLRRPRRGPAGGARA